MGLVVLQPMLQRLGPFKNAIMWSLVAKRFEPTELGEIVNKLIVEFFPDIVNVTSQQRWKENSMMSNLEKKSGKSHWCLLQTIL